MEKTQCLQQYNCQSCFCEHFFLLLQKQLIYDFLAGNNYHDSPHSQGFATQISPLLNYYYLVVLNLTEDKFILPQLPEESREMLDRREPRGSPNRRSGWPRSCARTTFRRLEARPESWGARWCWQTRPWSTTSSRSRDAETWKLKNNLSNFGKRQRLLLSKF